MNESPKKRLCMSDEPSSDSPAQGFVFAAAAPPNPTPARGRQGQGGLSVPKEQPRGRSEGAAGRALAPPKATRPSASPHAKSASPASPLQREQKRQLPSNVKAGPPITAKTRGTAAPVPGAKVGARPPVGAQAAEKMLQAAITLKNSKSLRQALAPARAALAKPDTVADANALLEKLVAAESAAFKELSSAQRESSQERSPPWRLLVLDFDRTIAKEHMWGTFKDAPLDQIPVAEETFSDLALFRWLVRSIRKRAGEVAIATFGRKDVAGKAMQFALGEDHGVFITTPADYPDPCQAEVKPDDEASPVFCPEGSAWLGNKNRQLAALAARFGVCAKDMMLLDDDLHNVQEAAKAGVSAHHCPTGLNKAAIRKAAEVLGLANAPPNSE